MCANKTNVGNATAQLDVAVSFCVVQALRAFQVHACSGNFQATGKKRRDGGKTAHVGNSGNCGAGVAFFFLVTLRDQFRTLGAISFRLFFFACLLSGKSNLARQYLGIENLFLLRALHTYAGYQALFRFFSWRNIAIFLDVSASIKNLEGAAGFFNAESAVVIED